MENKEDPRKWSSKGQSVIEIRGTFDKIMTLQTKKQKTGEKEILKIFKIVKTA